MMEIVSTKEAPAAIGPYSQAIKHGGLVYLSGQIPLNPATGTIVTGGIEEQTTQVITNLKNVLESAGSSLSKVLKTTVYLRDLNDFEGMNKVYSQLFNNHHPARVTVQVARLPKDSAIEIDAIAIA